MSAPRSTRLNACSGRWGRPFRFASSVLSVSRLTRLYGGLRPWGRPFRVIYFMRLRSAYPWAAWLSSASGVGCVRVAPVVDSTLVLAYTASSGRGSSISAVFVCVLFDSVRPTLGPGCPASGVGRVRVASNCRSPSDSLIRVLRPEVVPFGVRLSFCRSSARHALMSCLAGGPSSEGGRVFFDLGPH